MATDPFEEALRRRKQRESQVATDPFEQALARRRGYAEQEDKLSPMEQAVGLGRSVLRGATLGLSPRIEAGLRPDATLRDVRAEMERYSEENPALAFGAELAGGIGTGVLGGIRAAGSTGLRAIVPRIMATGAGQGAISGAAESEGGLREAATGAAFGAGIGVAAPAALRLAGRIPGVRQGMELAGRAGRAGARTIADLLEGTPLQAVGRAIEPQDLTRAQRIVREGLPGSVEGPTPRQLVPEPDSPREVSRRTRAALQQAEEAARVADEEAAGRIASARGKAELRQEIAGGRVSRLTEAAREAERQARELGGEITGQIRDITRGAREQAKAAAEATLEDIRGAAGRAVGALRGGQERGAARALQQEIRRKQLANAKQSYNLVRSFGPPPSVDPALYDEILSDPNLKSAYKKAYNTVRREAAKGDVPTPRMIQIGEQSVPEIDLYMMDVMRRQIREPAVRKGPNITGLSASQRREALNLIDGIENRFLDGYGSSEAGDLIRSVRGQYSSEFRRLEALQDGLGLGTVRAGKPSGLLTQSRKELDEVVDRVSKMSDAERAAFQVGAREWFSRMVSESPDDALRVARRFGSEASRERLRLAYGDDAVEQIAQFSPEVVGARTREAAQRVRGEAAQTVQGLQQRLATEQAPLVERAGRARTIAARAAERGKEAKGAFREVREQVGAEKAARAGEVGRLRSQAAAARAEIARAKEEGRDLRSMLPSVLSSMEGGADVARALSQAGPSTVGQSREIVGSMIQRRIASGESPQAIIETLISQEKNPAVRALMREELSRVIRQVQTPTISSALSGAFSAGVGGAASRRALEKPVELELVYDPNRPGIYP